MPMCKISADTNKEQREPEFSAAELLLHYAPKCLHNSTVQSALIVQTVQIAVLYRVL
jgi:hypothetical protein